MLYCNVMYCIVLLQNDLLSLLKTIVAGYVLLILLLFLFPDLKQFMGSMNFLVLPPVSRFGTHNVTTLYE